VAAEKRSLSRPPLRATDVDHTYSREWHIPDTTSWHSSTSALMTTWDKISATAQISSSSVMEDHVPTSDMATMDFCQLPGSVLPSTSSSALPLAAEQLPSPATHTHGGDVVSKPTGSFTSAANPPAIPPDAPQPPPLETPPPPPTLDENDDLTWPFAQINHMRPSPVANSFRYTIPNGKNPVHARFYRNKTDGLFPCVCGGKFATPEEAIEHLNHPPEDARAVHLLARKWPKS